MGRRACTPDMEGQGRSWECAKDAAKDAAQEAKLRLVLDLWTAAAILRAFRELTHARSVVNVNLDASHFCLTNVVSKNMFLSQITALCDATLYATAKTNYLWDARLAISHPCLE